LHLAVQCGAWFRLQQTRRLQLYTFLVNSNTSVQYDPAPEDPRVADACGARSGPCLSQEVAWSSEAGPLVGTALPCWRALRRDIAREDPAMKVKFTGLTQTLGQL
jgi:hypothetical protein